MEWAQSRATHIMRTYESDNVEVPAVGLALMPFSVALILPIDFIEYTRNILLHLARRPLAAVQEEHDHDRSFRGRRLVGLGIHGESDAGDQKGLFRGCKARV